MKYFLRKAYMGLFVWLISTAAFGQTYTLQAVVADSITKAALPGVAVGLQDGNSTTTSTSGVFTLTFSQLPQTLKLAYIGYRKNAFTITNANLTIDTIFMVADDIELDQVVVSASRQEQKLQEVTQSIEVVKPQFLVSTQTNQVQELMEKIPGVQVQKDQVTIRGGSGFSYGAGSRVLILLDEMPMLSADASDAKWSYFPVENLTQIEVLKGAASSLYGSSAMEGIISLSTAGAADTTFTQIRTFGGFYDFPDKQKNDMKGLHKKAGATLAHRRKIGPLHLISSAHYYKDDGFRIGDNDQLMRGNVKFIYMPGKKTKWQLSFSLNGMQNRGEDFLFFADASKTYVPFENTTTKFKNARWHSDFTAKYYASARSKHIFRSRYYTTINKNNEAQSSTGRLFFSEYQFQNTLIDKKNLRTTITAGVSNAYTQTISGVLYGNHSGNNTSAYFQADQKIGRLIISHGTRLEVNRMDTFPGSVFPVSRTGLNFQATKSTYLRASYGQGFRYPSVAERFVQTQAGALRLFPNPNLKPENGYTAEIGLKQLFLYRKLKGYLDIAAFTSNYKEMIEYQFGVYPPPNTIPNFTHIGFSAKNVPNTTIHGTEISLALTQNIGKAEVTLYGGYTYTLPLDDKFKNIDTFAHLKYLKFRRQHMVRANLEAGYKKISLGIYSYYNSETKNIDPFFIELIEGLKENNYWQTFSAGTVTDLRISYKPLKYLDLSVFCKNFFNAQYMEVPGNTNTPRIFTLQLTAQF